MRKKYSNWMLLILFFCLSIFAEMQNSHLGQVSVPVADRSTTSLQHGMPAAFAQAMMQVSNNPNVMMVPAVQAAEKNAMQWVQSYQFVDQAPATPNTKPVVMLQVNFDQTELQKLLLNDNENAEIKNTMSAKQNDIVQHPATQTATPLTVNHIQTMSDYENALQALREKKEVLTVTTSEINSDHVIFNVKLASDIAYFQQDLSNDHRFQPHVDYFQPADQANTNLGLIYSWVGS